MDPMHEDDTRCPGPYCRCTACQDAGGGPSQPDRAVVHEYLRWLRAESHRAGWSREVIAHRMEGGAAQLVKLTDKAIRESRARGGAEPSEGAHTVLEDLKGHKDAPRQEMMRQVMQTFYRHYYTQPWQAGRR